jgi:hypothetical protein
MSQEVILGRLAMWKRQKLFALDVDTSGQSIALRWGVLTSFAVAVEQLSKTSSKPMGSGASRGKASSLMTWLRQC